MNISPIHSQSIIPLHAPEEDLSSHAGPIKIAESVPPILREELTAEQIEVFEKKLAEKDRTENDANIRIATGVLSASSGVALGILITLGLTGVLLFSNPIGWGIAGGILLVTLIGSAYHGGPKEFFQNIGIAALGTSISLALGSLFGLGVPALATATANASRSTQALVRLSIMVFGLAALGSMVGGGAAAGNR